MYPVGNLRQYFQSQAGQVLPYVSALTSPNSPFFKIDFEWQETYGDVIRFKGSFGVRFKLPIPEILTTDFIC